MPQTPQTFQNHTRFFPLFHFFVMPILLVNFLNSLRHLYQEPTLHMAWAVVMAIGFMALALAARVMAVAVQDRVIRLEMRLRLLEVLPADLRSRVHELTPRHFVALRFASDAELADLVRDVLAGNLTSTKSIKQRVKDWQGDYLRA